MISLETFKNVAVDQSSHQKRQFELKSFLEEVISTLMPKLRKKNITLNLDCEEGLEVHSYPGDLFQILTNLMLNSEIHAFARVKHPEIQIRVSQLKQTILIDYLDNGCGMQEDIRQHVFEPFVTSRQEEGGSGLGMHIVYSLLTQKLKGKIQAINAGVGVHFQFSFPIRL